MAKITKPVTIDFNPEFTHALALMNESGKRLLTTSLAGTGKSTLLNFSRNHTKNVEITSLATWRGYLY